MYRDLDLSLRKHPITNDITMVTNKQAVLKAVRHLILYSPYEDQSDSGNNVAGIYHYLFDNEGSHITAGMVESKVISILTAKEHRISKISVATDFTDSAEMNITVRFRYAGTQIDDSVTIRVVRTS